MLTLLPSPPSSTSSMEPLEPATVPAQTQDQETEWTTLKKLSPQHKEAMALLAQGMKRDVVGSICGFSPEYITWLARQPLCRKYIEEMAEAVDARLMAMYEKSVDVIAEGMELGTVDEKLKAARLQMEAIGKIGRPRDPVGPPATSDRLEELAGRLVGLLRQQKERTFNGETGEIEDVPGYDTEGA